MTQIFKNMRVLLCALALSASVHAAAQAQSAVAATPTPTATPAPTATPTAYTPRYFGGGRQLSLAADGTFKSEFKSIVEAVQASFGNNYNTTLRKGSEIIVMNARCADDIFGDKVTFSMYSLTNETATLVKSFLDYVPIDGQKMWDLKRRELIAEIMRFVAIASPRKADCDAVPVALALSTTEALKLEVDDAQNPLIGAKINDGFLYDNLMQSNRFKAVASSMIPAEKRAFWEKFGYNRFATAQGAVDASTLLAGTKVIIHNGTSFSIYRLGSFKFDNNPSNSKTQFDVFKTTPIRKGLKIVAIVYGRELIKIYDPNVKQ